MAGYTPDADVDDMVAILLRVEDEDELYRYGLFAHEYLKAA